MRIFHRIRSPTGERSWQDDYTVYRFSIKEWLRYGMEGFLLMAAVSWLFYKSPIGLLLFIPFCPFWIRKQQSRLAKERRLRLRLEFKECLQSVAGTLHAGYSMENAWKDAEKDMERFLGKEADMTRELARMNRQVALNVPLERLLQDFAARSGLEDVQSFCQVFQFAKRGGGDMAGIMQNTYRRIADKTELEQGIETAMAAKRMEQKIMSFMPLFILLFLGLTSPGFLDGLYGNVPGVIVMSLCLGLYGVSLWIGERIVEIEI